ncbi:MAG: hypothetical protein MJY82_05915 [Fibrobacter sp.]|nr:hypothetical protein [Fibrobacter sp.]
MKFVKFLIVLLVLLCAGCTTDADDDDFDAGKVCPVEGMNAYGMPNRGTFVDERDGRVYKYTTIGNRMWMAENLQKVIGSRSDLYSLIEANQSCPVGWHLPSDDEWNDLIDAVGGADSAGVRLKATEGWRPLNRGDDGNGLDVCGFSMIPLVDDNFEISGFEAKVWTSTPDHAGGYNFKEFTSNETTVFTASDVSPYTKFVRCIKD